MEQTRNEDDAMRKDMRQNTEEKRVQKSKIYRKILNLFGQKRDTEMKSKR